MLYSRGFEMKVKVFFEPRMFFDKRIEKLDIEYKTLSQLIRRTTNNEDEILDILRESENFIITLEDCSGAASHVLENFEYLIDLFNKAGVDIIYINNPPKFFYDKLKKLSVKIEVTGYKFPKVTENKIKKIEKNFNRRIIGQNNAKKSIIRKLVAQMIRPSKKPLVLMLR